MDSEIFYQTTIKIAYNISKNNNKTFVLKTHIKPYNQEFKKYMK